MNVPKVLKIKKIVDETPTIKTFFFDWEMEGQYIPQPGQFVMVWNFKDEKPMSISFIDKNRGEIGITVKNVGSFTEDLHKLNVGDLLGIRGPYGTGFNMECNDKKILAIGGGVGMAPIASFTDLAVFNGANIDVVCAAQNKDELLFNNRLEKLHVNVFTVTDDGSCGHKGFATDRTSGLIENTDYDMAVVCGPEVMMKAIYDMLEDHDILAQYSLERYMKCAIGVCGQCCVDKSGWRICMEGPVFLNSDIKFIEEFGKYRRNAYGQKE